MDTKSIDILNKRERIFYDELAKIYTSIDVNAVSWGMRRYTGPLEEPITIESIDKVLTLFSKNIGYTYKEANNNLIEFTKLTGGVTFTGTLTYRPSIPVSHGVLLYKGKPILCTGSLPLYNKCITCELTSSKWYHLYIIDLDGTCSEFTPPIDEVGFCDDKWNPKELIAYAENNDYIIDALGLELFIGRWETEVLNKY